MQKLNQLAKIGQSIWLDYIQRSFIETGKLQSLVDIGLRGITSNPTIFDKAITGSEDYDLEIKQLAIKDYSVDDIYEELTVTDIQQAADILLPIYQQNQSLDGFVSLEVNPRIARDPAKTMAEAKKLWLRVQRPNLMVKIPATKEGIPAVSDAIAAGINVNVTLIFSIERYQEVIQAYLTGLEKRIAQGLSVDQISSVASFFISRMDTKVDKLLDQIIQSDQQYSAIASDLKGKSAIANAKIAYKEFQHVFLSERFTQLKEKGAQVQRPLWASTSTKNPAYSDILYVQELIGPYTVNTVPQDTLESFLMHGEVRSTLEDNLSEAILSMENLKQLGISIYKVTQELENEGVNSFEQSFSSLMDNLEHKRQMYVR